MGQGDKLGARTSVSISINILLPVILLFNIYLRDHFWVWIQVDGVVVPPEHEVPAGLDVRDLHGVADGLDVRAGGACDISQVISIQTIKPGEDLTMISPDSGPKRAATPLRRR